MAFDDDRLVADAGAPFAATLAQHLGLKELVERGRLQLGAATGRANVGDAAVRARRATARSARRVPLHLFTRWPWATRFEAALARFRALPLLA